MAWGYVRITILTGAFLIGLLLPHFGGHSAESGATTAQTLRETDAGAPQIQIRCNEKRNFTLVQTRTDSTVADIHHIGM